HRDIKPANLMLVDEVRKDASGGALGGVVKVTDLGLAQIRENTENECPTDRTIGVVVGTPSYMPPEQARGEHVDFRADVYALGATLYHFVTGQRPFDCKTLREALRSKQEDRLAHPQDLNPDLSDDFILVLDRMLAHKRDDRYQSYEDLLLDLQALVVGMRPATSAIPTSASSFEHRRQRSPRKTTRIKLAEDDTPEPFRLRLNLPKRHQRLRRLLGVVLAFGSGLVLGLLLR
ncbi:MAG: serine/threonine protein kinase, partial [Salinibacterium sp.]|nr:serine/threonine protein kinase [Salinibacterium sp.]